MEIICHQSSELSKIAQQIIKFAGEEKIWLLNGEMGAGKTTLTKAICEVLGVLHTVNSPTFALVNEYETMQNEVIYHFDFYRIKNTLEALEIGVYEYLDSGNLCLIEWSSKISSLLPSHYLQIDIEKSLNPLEQEWRLIKLKRI